MTNSEMEQAIVNAHREVDELENKLLRQRDEIIDLRIDVRLLKAQVYKLLEKENSSGK